MNKYIYLIIFLGILITGGIFYATNKSKNINQHGEDMNITPAAQSHRSYNLEVTSKTESIKPNTEAEYRYIIKNDKREVLKDFATVHEKIMHFIVVRKDLQNFQHIHPTYDKDTGEFSIVINFPTDGPYRLFPDFTPGKSADNPQGLTVTLHDDVNVGDMNKYKAEKFTADTTNIKQVGDYRVTYNMPSDLKAQTEYSYNLNVEEKDQPVTDLENYLGALGHGVILRADTLDFIHTHAGEAKPNTGSMVHDMSKMNNVEGHPTRGPKINFSTSFPEPGKYIIFTQFQHKGKVITANRAIEVR